MKFILLFILMVGCKFNEFPIYEDRTVFLNQYAGSGWVPVATRFSRFENEEITCYRPTYSNEPMVCEWKYKEVCMEDTKELGEGE